MVIKTELNAHLRSQIIGFYRGKHTFGQMYIVLRISRSTILSVVEKWRSTVSTLNLICSGKPPKLSH